jgi:hypothetical protein
MKLTPPAYCLGAWVKFLRSQGATIAGTAAALGVTELEAARLVRHRVPPRTQREHRAAGLTP